MALSSEEVRHLARLARLQLSDEERVSLGETLERVLEYVGRLSSIDTQNVPETEAMNEMSVVREDGAVPTEDQDLERLQALFPDKLGTLLRVPGVFEKPKG